MSGQDLIAKLRPEYRSRFERLSPEGQARVHEHAARARGDNPILSTESSHLVMYEIAIDSEESIGANGNAAPAAVPTGAEVAEPWHDPVLPSDPDALPDFPTEHLPGWIAATVDAVAISLQVPVAMVAQAALAVLSTAVARKVVVHDGGDWYSPVNLYLVCTAESGERKSPVFQFMTEELSNWEREQAPRVTDSIAEAENARKICEHELSEKRREAAKATGPERALLVEETKKLSRELAQMPAPTYPRLFAGGDVTPEALAALLRDNGERVGVLDSEGGLFSIMAGRYAKDSASNFEIYLHGWSGDAVRVDRITRPPILLSSPALTMGLLVQPDVIRSLGARPEFRGRGLLGRFLYSFPRSFVGSRRASAPPVPSAVADGYHARLRALINLEPATNVFSKPSPHVLPMGADAKAELDALHDRIEPQLAPDGELRDRVEWGKKLLGQTVRLAGLLHVADRVGEREPWREPMDARTMRRAILYVESFYMPHSLAAYDEIGSNPTAVRAGAILRWVRRKQLSEFSRADLHRAQKHHVDDPEAWDAPLALLEAQGAIRRRPTTAPKDPQGRGRPSTGVFDVNPKVLAVRGAR